MQTPLMPASMTAPAAQYAHGVLVTGANRWVYTSGIVPVDSDGGVPVGVAAQATLIWRNIAAILADADMDANAVLSVTTYVVSAAMATGLAAAMAARDAYLGGRRVASTLVTVPALAQPAWMIEIAVVAAC